jgi:hypothetical protein
VLRICGLKRQLYSEEQKEGNVKDKVSEMEANSEDKNI